MIAVAKLGDVTKALINHIHMRCVGLELEGGDILAKTMSTVSAWKEDGSKIYLYVILLHASRNRHLANQAFEPLPVTPRPAHAPASVVDLRYIIVLLGSDAEKLATNVGAVVAGLDENPDLLGKGQDLNDAPGLVGRIAPADIDSERQFEIWNRLFGKEYHLSLIYDVTGVVLRWPHDAKEVDLLPEITLCVSAQKGVSELSERHVIRATLGTVKGNRILVLTANPPIGREETVTLTLTLLPTDPLSSKEIPVEEWFGCKAKISLADIPAGRYGLNLRIKRKGSEDELISIGILDLPEDGPA